jgi:alpha-tubulin suppressor-like RCC1 family protein
VSVSLPGAASAIATSQASSHACAIRQSDGSIWCWGLNGNGQLGDGTKINRNVPVRVSTYTGAVSVATGAAHTCAAFGDGTVRCWGAGTDGMLGHGATTESLTGVQVSGISNAVQVTAGNNFACARLQNGYVWCWGLGTSGQLGNNGTSNSSTPVIVSGLPDATDVSAGGAYACAVVTGGDVNCWGYNGYGQLGDNTTTNRLTPTPPSVSLSGVTDVSTGDVFTCAVMGNGATQCWGYNGNYALGDNTNVSRYVRGAVSEIEPALVTSTSVPGAVSGIAVTGRTDTAISLKWNAPARNGGAAIDDYKVEYSSDSVNWTTCSH